MVNQNDASRTTSASQVPGLPIPSPLISFVLRGLDSCWMPEQGRWSHIYHLDGRAQPNESVPYSDVFYTLNVLLGFSRIQRFGPIHNYDLQKIFETNVVLVPRLPSRKYAYGMALWAGAELGFAIPAETDAQIGSLLEDHLAWKNFSAQDLGMLLIGCVEQTRRGNRKLNLITDALFKHLDRFYAGPSGLFYEGATGWRRRLSSFATQTYLSLACYIYGDWAQNKRAIELAKACSRKLIALQGPQGEWPWFFYTPAGRVVDFYEVYSVHQDDMAPAWLEHAEKHGVPGAREALIKGFLWIYGQNQLSRSMLWKKEGLICRSHLRRGEKDSKKKRIVRAMINAIIGGGQHLISPERLDLHLECRSYHLGWMLWAFGLRDDLSELQHHSYLQ